MVQRVTYRRQCSYSTRSNKIKKVKTPGGKLVAHHLKKKTHTSRPLGGIPVLRSNRYHNMARTKKSVSRIYGGHLTSQEVKERIIRAFLTEEVKVVKQIMLQGLQEKKKEKKTTKK